MNEIVDHDMFARRTETQWRPRPRKCDRHPATDADTFRKSNPLALKIRPEITANMRTFIPDQPEPVQPVINRGRSFLCIARFIRILDAQNKRPAVMAREEPVEKRRARAADVQITSRRWSETNTNSGIHTIIL